jgi:transposase
MALGTRRKRQRQHALWVAASDLPTTAAHPFYERLNALLDEHRFDAFVEGLCQPFYATTMGRPSVAPGIYFRLLLIGYFEGVDSERGIAWRAADSLAIRRFLRVALDEAVPDHSTISRTRRLIDLETHRAVFTWVQQRLGAAGLLKGKTVAIDATTLEANAAMRSIVRRDTGDSYQAFLTGLAEASGIKTPTREALARLDRKRKKKTSNKDWTSPTDPDAKVTKMKDGRTHLAHKAEHAVDLDTGAIIAVTVQGADQGDTTTLEQTLGEAVDQLTAVADETDPDVETAPDVVADKGYHSRRTVLELETNGFRTYISEPDRGPQRWKRQADARDAVYANRRRIHGDRGLRLLRRRGEYVERTFAHVYDTGGMRRTHLRGHTNILKRLLIHAGAFNLGLVMRHLMGTGTPRGLQGRLAAVIASLVAVWHIVTNAVTTDFVRRPLHPRSITWSVRFGLRRWLAETRTCTTGC